VLTHAISNTGGFGEFGEKKTGFSVSFRFRVMNQYGTDKQTDRQDT